MYQWIDIFIQETDNDFYHSRLGSDVEGLIINTYGYYATSAELDKPLVSRVLTASIKGYKVVELEDVLVFDGYNNAVPVAMFTETYILAAIVSLLSGLVSDAGVSNDSRVLNVTAGDEGVYLECS